MRAFQSDSVLVNFVRLKACSILYHENVNVYNAVSTLNKLYAQMLNSIYIITAASHYNYIWKRWYYNLTCS